MIKVHNGVPNPYVREAVLFPFDDRSIPFSAGLQLNLVSGKSGAANPIVLSGGKPGEPDDATVRFYGSVVQIGDELRMWYQSRGSLDPDGGPDFQFRTCYAVSRDGVRWEKPKLGLVEYNGSRDNNVVDVFGGRCVVWSAPVIHDPEDPDPARRFKMVIESGVLYGKRMGVAYSPDGLTWTESPDNPVGPGVSHSGLIKYNGCYYVNGQDGDRTHSGTSRKLVTHASYDFEHWTEASCLGMRREGIPPRPVLSESNTREEVHRGAGLWDRGNVIIGVYDMLHGHPSGESHLTTTDLGLVVSNDGLYYREPIPDFRLVPAYAELQVTLGIGPFLKHAQAMCNVKDLTMCWYEAWYDGDIRLATWPRDRLGFFRTYRESSAPTVTVAEPEGLRDRRVAAFGGRPIAVPDRRPGDAPPEPHFVSCVLSTDGSAARLFANVDVSDHSPLTVEVLDEQFRPVAGYSGDECIPLRRSALRQPVAWRDRAVIGGVDGGFRLKVTFGGVRPEDARFYALYVTEAD